MVTRDPGAPMPGVDRRYQGLRVAAALLALVAAGIAGNHWRLPLFLGVEFLWGSVFALLALLWLGRGPGALAALLVSASTWLIWNHPYAIVILTAEVMVSGLLMRRLRVSLVFADALYWILLGMPLAWVFFRGLMDVPPEAAVMVMAKQAVNGIANAVLASIVFGVHRLLARPGTVSYRELIQHLFACFALLPALFLLVQSGQRDFRDTDAQVRAELHQSAGSMASRVESWLQSRTRALVHLAGLAVTLPPAQMQARLDQARGTDGNFLRIGMRDADSTVVAYSPLMDEEGRANVGKRFPERPLIAEVRRTLQPMLQEVVVARIGGREPVANLLAPVVRGGAFDGYINGVLGLHRIREQLDEANRVHGSRYAILDRKGLVVLTNHPGLAAGTPFTRPPGTLLAMEGGVSQWVPEQKLNENPMSRWRASSYVRAVPVGADSTWTLVAEQPIAFFQATLNARYAESLATLLAILVVALGIAEWLARRATRATQAVARLARGLPADLSAKRTPQWPVTVLREPNEIIDALREMARQISRQLDSIRHANETLEARVAERTAALQQAEEASRRAADEYRGLFESTADGVWLLQEGLTLVDVNAAYCRLSGYGREELIGRSVADLEALEARQAREAGDETGPHRAGFAGKGGGRYETRHRRKDGSLLDVEVSATHVASTGRTVVFVRDIGERRRLAEARVRSRNLESLGTLAGGIAHDFNNILSAIRGNAELAAEDVGEDHPAMASLSEIRRGGARASELVRRITAFGRPKGAERTHMALAPVVEEVLKLLRSTLPATLSMRMRVGGGVPDVRADPAQVHEALVNLATNAAHAIGREGGAIDFTVEALTLGRARARRLGIRPGPYAAVRVRDTGCGMDKDTIARAFDAYFTTKPTGEGSGLGLAMVYGIMQGHEGAVAVESEPGQGAVFTLYFPPADGAAPPADDSCEAPQAPAPAPGGRRILYVDDEDSLVRLATRALNRLGHEVTAFSRPEDALVAFAADPDAFDAVVTDLAMPGLSGFALASRVLALRPDVPVILTTGYIQPEDEAAARAIGIRQVVPKPATIRDLADVLDGVFRGDGAPAAGGAVE